MNVQYTLQIKSSISLRDQKPQISFNIKSEISPKLNQRIDPQTNNIIQTDVIIFSLCADQYVYSKLKLKEHTLVIVSINPNAYIKADYNQLKHIFAYCTPMSSSVDKQRKKASFIYLKLAMSSQRTALLPLQRMKYFISRTKSPTNVITFQPIQNCKNKLN